MSRRADVPSIPTWYRGHRFRSRLEARWAAFFDLCEWPWQYEPLDLNGYIPDFALLFPQPLLVEVKPALIVADLQQYTGKVEASGWPREALILGTGLVDEGGADRALGQPTLGLLAERFKEDGVYFWAWGEAALMRCRLCGRPSLCHAIHSFHCRRCGRNDHHVRELPEADGWWAEAANRTQWRGR